MALKAVLFDLDGVLLDTEGIYSDFWSEVNRRYPTGVEDFARRIKGSTLTDIFEKYFAPEVRSEIIEMLKRQEHEMVYRLYPGAAKLLEELRYAGIPTAIVTSSNRPKMEVVYSRLPLFADYVTALITDEDVTASKPDPQGYLSAADRLGIDPADCVVVEDSLAGLKAGRAAGAKVLAVTTTNTLDDVAPLADAVVNDVSHANVDLLKSMFD